MLKVTATTSSPHFTSQVRMAWLRPSASTEAWPAAVFPNINKNSSPPKRPICAPQASILASATLANLCNSSSPTA